MEKVQFFYDVLGRNVPLHEIISSAVLSIITFFYFYTVSTFFNVPVFLLEGKITYGFLFESYVVARDVDHIIIIAGTIIWLAVSLRNTRLKASVCTPYGTLALLSVIYSINGLTILCLASGPLIASSLVLSRVVSVQTQKTDYSNLVSFNMRLYLTYLSLIAIYVGIVSLILTLSFFFSISEQFLLMNLYLRNYVYQIYLVLSAFSPVLLILLAFCFPVKLIANKILNRFKNKDGKKIITAPIGIDLANKEFTSNIAVRRDVRYRTATYLILIMLGSSFLTLVPLYSASVYEIEDEQIGVDTDYYIRITRHLIHVSEKGGIIEVLNQVFVTTGGDRPIALLFVFYIGTILKPFGELSYIINSIPVILAPLLVLAIYFMTREITLNLRASLFAALLTTVSAQILVGIYAGFYANWLALIVGYSCMGFLFRYLRNPSKANISFFSALLVLLLITHIYTWAMLTLVMGIFLTIIILKLGYYSKRSLGLLLLILVSVVAIDVLRSSILGTSSGIEIDEQIEEMGLEFNVLMERWYTLTNTSQQYLGGLLGNSIIYLIGLYWLFKCNYKSAPNLMMLIVLSMAVVPFLIGDWVAQSRVLYNIPFQVPAAIGLVYILHSSNLGSERAGSPQIGGKLIITAIYLWSFAIGLRLLLNLYPS